MCGVVSAVRTSSNHFKNQPKPRSKCDLKDGINNSMRRNCLVRVSGKVFLTKAVFGTLQNGLDQLVIQVSNTYTFIMKSVGGMVPYWKRFIQKADFPIHQIWTIYT